MDKKNILLIIDDLGIGGAETLLVGILPDLNTIYNVILVTLTKKNDFGNQAFICKKKYIKIKNIFQYVNNNILLI